MLDRDVTKRSKPNAFLGKTYVPIPPNSITPSHDQIRQRAYELYELRGRQDGFSEQDWLEAEQQMLAGRK
jgi:hypothetical protein